MMDENVPRRTRASKPKVRTGCHTCKQRRIKCDEQKPACAKCSSTGRICAGYDPIERPVEAGKIRKLLPNVKPSTSETVINLPILHPVLADIVGQPTADERRSLDFFRNRTAQEITGWFDSDLWARLILQMSNSEPAIRHAIIALSSIHESHELNGMPVGLITDDLTGKHYRFGIEQYSRAVTLLQTRLHSNDRQGTLVVLTACLIFIHLEIFHGHYTAAVEHMRNGLSMLSELKARGCEPATSGIVLSNLDPKDLEDNLLESFAHLDLEATFYVTGRPQLHLISKKSPLPLGKHPQFTTFLEARRSLNSISNALYCLVGQNLAAERTPANELRQEELRIRLECWSAAFDAYVSNNTASDKDLGAAMILRMNQITFSIVAATCLADGVEAIFDDFIPDFEKIVALASEVSQNPASIKCMRTFSVEDGVILPLCFTAYKCREPYIRREAVAILEAKRHREGFWESALAVKMNTFIIAYEEGGWDIGGPGPVLPIPEVARLHHFSFEMDDQNDRENVKFTTKRKRHESDGEWEIREQWFKTKDLIRSL